MKSQYFLGRTLEGNLIYAQGVNCTDDGRVVVRFNADSTLVCSYIQKFLEKSCHSKEGNDYTIPEEFIECWNREIISGRRRWSVGVKSTLSNTEGVIYAEVLSLNLMYSRVLVWIPNSYDLPTDKLEQCSEFKYKEGCFPAPQVYEIPVKVLQEWSACVEGEDCEYPYEEPSKVAKELMGSWADYVKRLSDILCKDIDLYQQKCLKYAKYPETARIIYPTLGLTGEAGEVSDKVKKVIRDNEGDFTDEIKKEIMKELGDVLWYCATLAHDLGFYLSDVAFGNIEKLESRFQRNKIGGSGDNR